MSKDYYSILGVGRDASPDEIKRAYRQLARQHHPDVNGNGAESEEKFKELGEAYAVLSDPEKRQRYDTYGSAGPSDFGIPQDFDIFDIFNQAFGFSGGRRGATPGRDLQLDVKIDLEEVLTGASRTIKLKRQVTCETCEGTGAKPGTQPDTCQTCGGQGRVRQMQQSFFGNMVTVVACPTCRGRGTIIREACEECGGSGITSRTEDFTVEIPPGIETGQHLQYDGYGDMGEGGYPGDLYVRVIVSPHPLFTREGTTLRSTVPITFWQAALGDKITIKLLEGEHHLQIEPGTQSGTEVVLHGKGLPQLRRRGRGAHVVTLKVVTPEDLSPRQRELFEDLARAFGEDLPAGGAKGFFTKVKETLKGE
ncbi:MAG: molecular chaperone DnaJ [Armatimonadota bacterium]